MPHPRTSALAAALAVAVCTGASLGLATPDTAAPAARTLLRADGHRTGGEALARLADRAFGRSGALRVVFTDAGQPLQLPIEWNGSEPADVAYRWLPLAGSAGPGLLGETPLRSGLQAPARNGIFRLQLRAPGWTQEVTELSVITRVPFAAKQGGILNGYRIGSYWTEGQDRTDAYAPPAGFIEVTPENQDMAISRHFRLRNFLTKNQHSVWPKYLALDLRLIDKLELVMQELNAMGVRAEHMAVMSGFRTPAYNGPGEGGRARLSRHTYGDASDVWVDNDRDGQMDDLNGDGRSDVRDAVVVLRAVERVEEQHPELAGGAGVYHANSAHGPFIHIDARGSRARW